jgi:PilZ domain
MSKPERERRHAKRFPMVLPATVRAQEGTEQKCTTRDISASGVFIYCNAELAEDAAVDLVLILPPEIIGGSGTKWVCCHGRVIRAEKDSDSGQQGWALKTERLEVMPEITAAE